MRSRLPLVVVGILVVVTGVAVWLVGGRQSISAVEVSWKAEPECDGAKVKDLRRGSDDRRGPVILARKGMSCVIRVEIRNTGTGDVTLERMVMPALGPGAGGVVREPDAEGDAVTGVDSVRVLDEPLAADESLVVDIEVVFRNSGCNGGDGLTWVEGWPRVEISTMGRDGAVSGADTFAWRQDGFARGCVDR